MMMHSPEPAFFMTILAMMLLAGLVTLILVLVALAVRAFYKRKNDLPAQDQIQAIQELHRLAQRLEKRVDSLETILYESTRRKNREDDDKSL
jgi:phage shock protein B